MKNVKKRHWICFYCQCPTSLPVRNSLDSFFLFTLHSLRKTQSQISIIPLKIILDISSYFSLQSFVLLYCCIYFSLAVGEPPLCMSCASLFAVKHAVEEARAETSEGSTYFAMSKWRFLLVLNNVFGLKNGVMSSMSRTWNREPNL